MRRMPARCALVTLTLLAGACGGTGAAGPLTSPRATVSATVGSSPPPSMPLSPSPTASPSPSPTPAPQLRLPADAPTTFADPLEPDAIPVEALMPPGAGVTSTWKLTRPQDPLALIALAWSRGADPFAKEHGFVVWERLDGQTPPWQAVYAFTDAPSKGVLGLRVSLGDLTADGIEDALTFEDTGGSGACGTWRVISPTAGVATEIFRKRTCDTEIVNSAGTLKIRQAVFAPGDAHCCPSSFHMTIMRWDGQRFVSIKESDTGTASAAG